MNELVNTLRQRWNQLAKREQQLVGFGGSALIIALLYLLIIEPLVLGVSQLENKVEKQQKLKVWMEQSAFEVKALQQNGAGATRSGSLLQMVSSSSRRFKVRPNRVEPQGQAVQVWLEDASFDDVLRWLDHLAATGIQVNGMSLNREEASGRVRGRIKLQAG